MWIISTNSLFTNIYHLFSRVIPKMDEHQFAWILCYIQKCRNNKVFSNLDIDPMDTLNLAETKSTLQTEAQTLQTQRVVPNIEAENLPSIPGRWRFVDASWKENDPMVGQGWYNTLEGFDPSCGDGSTTLAYGRSHLQLIVSNW